MQKLEISKNPKVQNFLTKFSNLESEIPKYSGIQFFFIRKF